jgi:osmoprotectant transport system permease protein
VTDIADSAAPARPLTGRLDKVGIIVALLAALALVVEPFATNKPNRLLSGKSLSLAASLPTGWAIAGFVLLALAIVFAAFRSDARIRLAVGAAALIWLAILIGLVPAFVVTPGNTYARVSPATGFWMLTFAFAVLTTDAIAKLSLGPFARLAILAATAAALAILLISGHWNGLSILKEYATNSDQFWLQGAKHIELALGSLAAAIVVGLPLGIACHRNATLRGLTLPVLNIIQTIPSMAMYGLMIVPLSLFAAAFPIAGTLGIRGIGTAPAVIALFLYSLLPVVANTYVGLSEVRASVVDAAEGMGMTARQRLFQVELPLAFPVILTGIRIVLVQNIGLVTIAALIGGGGFGTFVFQGMNQAANDLVLLGAIPTIALAFTAAILLDCAIELSERRRA